MSSHNTPASDRLLDVRNVRKAYGTGRRLSVRSKPSVQAVDGISFYLCQEEALAIVGESGSGKSTMARMLLGLEPPSEGEILYEGTSLAMIKGSDWVAYRAGVQAVFQDPWASLNSKRTVGKSISEPLEVLLRLKRAARAARVAELLSMVSLDPNVADSYPHELSGGMRQRVAIARALAPNPSCLVLDEPVSALDVSIKAQVMNLLKDLQEQLAVAYVLIAHDLASVRFFADRVLVMSRGRIVEAGKTDLIFGDARHPYTKMLLAAAPSVEFSRPGGGELSSPTGSSWRTDGEGTDDGSPCVQHGDLRELCGRDGTNELTDVGEEHLVACSGW